MASEYRGTSLRRLIAAGAALLPTCSGCTSDLVLLGDGRPSMDAGAPPAPVEWPVFGEPALLDVNSENHDDDPTLTGDLLEMFFSSERDHAGTGDIYTTTRTAVTAPWEPPTLVDALTTEGDDGGCAITPSGLVIYLSRQAVDSATGLDVWRATRTDRGATWSEPVLVEGLNTDSDELVRWVDDDETMLLFGRRSADGPYDLQVAERASAVAPWAESDRLAGFNTPNNEADPFLAVGEQLLVFARKLNEDEDNDLVMARLDPAGGEFVDLQPIAALNSDAEDSDAWLAEDASYVVFASRRADDTLNLYEAFATVPAP